MQGYLSTREVQARERRRWWIIRRNGLPALLTGYSASFGGPDYWWFPEEGVSTGDVYATEEEARTAAADRVDREIADLSAIVDALKNRTYPR